MSIKKICMNGFSSALKESGMPSDLQRHITDHERKSMFLSNMEEQLNLVERLRLSQGKGPLKKETLEWATFEMTNTFIQTVLEHKELQAKPAIEKTKIKAEHDNLRDIESTLQGKPSGDFADIVESVEDTRDE